MGYSPEILKNVSFYKELEMILMSFFESCNTVLKILKRVPCRDVELVLSLAQQSDWPSGVLNMMKLGSKTARRTSDRFVKMDRREC